MLNRNPAEWLSCGIIGVCPSLPLLFTLLSLFLYPTAWVFIWLILHIGLFLIGGIAQKEKTAVILAITGFVVLLINLKLTFSTNSTNSTPSNVSINSTPISTDVWNNGWFLPVKILIAVASVIGILFLLRWMIREFFPILMKKQLLKKC